MSIIAFLKNKIFEYNQKKRIEQERLLAKKIEDEKIYKSFDFIDKYEKKIDKMIEKIDCNINEYGDYPPNLAREQKKYTKVSALIKELKEFCYSNGEGGQYYYDTELAYYEDDCEDYYNNFLNDDFVELQKEYEEEITFKKKQKQMKDDIIRVIKENEGILQKDLYSKLNLEKKVIQNIINDLEKSKIISKEKSGNSYIISII